MRNGTSRALDDGITPLLRTMRRVSLFIYLTYRMTYKFCNESLIL